MNRDKRKKKLSDSRIKYQLYIRSSELKSNDFANSGEVKMPFSDAATEKARNRIYIKLK